ncbi:MAG: S8 family peptidase [Pseudomonadota bacterium]
MRLASLSLMIMVALIGLTACDQRAERLERASDLSSAVFDQLTGRDVGSANPKEAMQSLAVDARAFQGQMQPTFFPDLPETSQSRFIMGSIIAKPKDLAPEDTSIQQPQPDELIIESAATFDLAVNLRRLYAGEIIIEIVDETSQPVFAVETEDLSCNIEAEPQGQARSPESTMICFIEVLETSGAFEYVEKDYLFEHQMTARPDSKTAKRVVPDDPLFHLQWPYQNPDQIAGGAGFIDFWTREATQGTSKVVIALIDTGLDLNHPDIQNSPNLAKGWDMVTHPEMSNDGNGRDPDPVDPGDLCRGHNQFEDSWHGTHIAGTLGAGLTNNTVGTAGGARDIKVVPVRALGKCGGRLSDINDSIRWAAGAIPDYDAFGNEVWNENPADIINLSFGLFKSCPASLQDAIDAVTATGVTIVAAAGNHRVSTEFFAPAGCQNVITVAASDARGHLAHYSNFGRAVDLMAPGGDLGRDDNADGYPDGILSTKRAEMCLDPVDQSAVPTCYYAFEEGSSMAAAHVSAALALIKSKRPDLTRLELLDTLMAGVTPTTDDQCRNDCLNYPGAEPIAGSENICLRRCGAGLLNLSGIVLDGE